MLKDLLLSSPLIYKLSQVVLGKDKDLMNLAGEIGAGAKVFDIGCGPASLLKRLPESVEYHGFDPSPSYVKEARAAYKNRKAFFYCAGVDDFVLGADIKGSCDVAIASGVLHHLDDSQAKKLLNLAYNSLKEGGKLLTLDVCFIPRQNPIARFLAKSDRGKYVRYQDEYAKILKEVFLRNTSVTVYSDGGHLPYNHIVMKAQR